MTYRKNVVLHCVVVTLWFQTAKSAKLFRKEVAKIGVE